MRLVESLNNDGRRSSASVADRRASDGGVLLGEHVVESTDDTSTRAADGVTQSHRSSVSVHTIDIQVQQPNDRQQRMNKINETNKR